MITQKISYDPCTRRPDGNTMIDGELSDKRQGVSRGSRRTEGTRSFSTSSLKCHYAPGSFHPRAELKFYLDELLYEGNLSPMGWWKVVAFTSRQDSISDRPMKCAILSSLGSHVIISLFRGPLCPQNGYSRALDWTTTSIVEIHYLKYLGLCNLLRNTTMISAVERLIL